MSWYHILHIHLVLHICDMKRPYWWFPWTLPIIQINIWCDKGQIISIGLIGTLHFYLKTGIKLRSKNILYFVPPSSGLTALMEAASTYETSVNFYETTQCNSPEDSHLHTHHCENHKSQCMHLIVCTSVLLTWCRVHLWRTSGWQEVSTGVSDTCRWRTTSCCGQFTASSSHSHKCLEMQSPSDQSWGEQHGGHRVPHAVWQKWHSRQQYTVQHNLW
jgi:hypothetical protein